MRYVMAAAGLVALTTIQAGAGSSQPPQVIDPTGTYTVRSTTDDGTPFEGTLTVRAAETGFDGVFESTATGPLVVRQVTTNRGYLMAIFESPNGLAMSWLERQADGTFRGTWHELGAGFGVTATKRAGEFEAPAR